MWKKLLWFLILFESVAVGRDVLCIELANIIVVFNGVGESGGIVGKPEVFHTLSTIFFLNKTLFVYVLNPSPPSLSLLNLRNIN